MRNCGFIRLPNSNFGYNINIASLFPPPPLSLCIEDELNCGIFHGIQNLLNHGKDKIMAIPYFVNMSSCDSNMHPWAKSRRRDEQSEHRRYCQCLFHNKLINYV